MPTIKQSLEAVPDMEGQFQDSILTSYTEEAFQHIEDPAVELIMWQRTLEPSLTRWLDAMPVCNLPHARFKVLVSDLVPTLTAVLDGAGMPEGAMRQAFLQDVTKLAMLFIKAMGCDGADIRLETIRHDACWKFHRDYVPARMLTTYRGPGTEWVLPNDSETALVQQRSYSGVLQQFPRHAVGLFKGRHALPARGIVHRSPPIKNKGETRLLLCINLPSAISPSE